MPLEPPTEGRYQSKEELFKRAQEHAQIQGYAVVTRSSRQGLIYLQCDKGGTFKNVRNLTEETRKRRANSKCTGCPFMIKGKEMVDDEGRWHLSVMEPDHNHPPSDNLTDHSILRRLDEDQKLLVRKMRAEGSKPTEIVKYFNDNNLPPIMIKDVHNIMKKFPRSSSSSVDSALNSIESLVASFESPPQPTQPVQPVDTNPRKRGRPPIHQSQPQPKRKVVKCSRCHQTGHSRAHPDCPLNSTTPLPPLDLSAEDLASWAQNFQPTFYDNINDQQSSTFDLTF
ncbi:hypothetical protein E3P99_00904 [Wallemia hederae]|uniref:FAR1 domain-containing protein n=1 Tax=Wallemia hederae TaxID=1540922 RepID=A0A4T0FTA9_9BASI|nr:hypothetical protein E3P99_00904 [Wallemia hederae]